MRYDLLDLRLFVLVVEEGSITAGAQRLPLSLPSASARIRGLEQTAGVELLVRERRGVRPTPAGAALARHAREVVGGLTRLEGAVAGYTGAGRTVCLVAGSSPMQRLVPRAMVTFLSAHADVDVVALERRSADGVRLLADGDADLGVIIVPRHEPLPPPADRLTDDSLVAVGPPDGVLAGRERLTWAEVAEHPLVGLAADAPLQRTLEVNVGGAAPLARYRGRAPALAAVVDLVAAGVGLAVVPRHVVDPARGLEVCELADEWARRMLVLRRGVRAGAAVEDLAAHLHSAARSG